MDCGETIDLFKSNGGMLTAKMENLRLPGSLPIEPRVVSGGDDGDMSILENLEIPFSNSFNKIVEAVVEIMEGKKSLH